MSRTLTHAPRLRAPSLDDVQHIVLEEGLPGAMSARDIQDSYHVHDRLSITLHWRD